MDKSNSSANREASGLGYSYTAGNSRLTAAEENQLSEAAIGPERQPQRLMESHTSPTELPQFSA